MLSIGKLGPGSEDYYLREVAGPEEYYLGAGEAPGYWLGIRCTPQVCTAALFAIRS